MKYVYMIIFVLFLLKCSSEKKSLTTKKEDCDELMEEAKRTLQSCNFELNQNCLKTTLGYVERSISCNPDNDKVWALRLSLVSKYQGENEMNTLISELEDKVKNKNGYHFQLLADYYLLLGEKERSFDYRQNSVDSFEKEFNKNPNEVNLINYLFQLSTFEGGNIKSLEILNTNKELISNEADFENYRLTFLDMTY